MDASKPKVTAKDFFLWLGAMVALYVSATSLILLLHQYVNVWFPNELEYYASYSGTIRFAIASLIVFFPVYVWLTRILHQDIRKVPEKKELWVRKWLIFLTLFVAGITMAIDLVITINTFLNGDLTIRFLLKAGIILAVIGAGFWYYLNELRGKWEANKSQSTLIGGIVSGVVLVSIIGAFFIIGSPETQRLSQLDSRKVGDLQNIQYQLVNYWQQKQELPNSLSDLSDPISGFAVPIDPQTGEPYSYKPTGTLSFQLCATFNTDVESDAQARPKPVGMYDMTEENWKHGKGQTCFDRTIDPERYPPVPKR